MRCAPSGLRGVATAVAATALVATAAAHADSPPLRIDYQAHAACPDAAALVDEITRRTPLARFATASEAALEVRARITITRRGESRGHLAIGAGAGRVVRDIASASCEEIVSAFALITALAIDPNASTAPRPPPLPPSPPEPPPPAAPLPPQASLARALHPGAALPPGDLLAPPLPVVPALEPARAARGLWIVGARASASFDVAPRPLLGGGIVVERAFDAGAHASLSLGVELAQTGDFTVGPAGASFWQATVRVEGCAFGQRPRPHLLFVPCVRAEGGALGGAGIPGGALTTVQKALVPWLGVGFAPRVAADIGRVVVELSGGPTFPLVRRIFRFDSPDYLIHEVPPVVWSIGFGAGVRFP
jgi:hypothetical protein